jgi:hypothetical protein
MKSSIEEDLTVLARPLPTGMEAARVNKALMTIDLNIVEVECGTGS